jgi:hypothetical protein
MANASDGLTINDDGLTIKPTAGMANHVPFIIHFKQKSQLLRKNYCTTASCVVFIMRIYHAVWWQKYPAQFAEGSLVSSVELFVVSH